MSDFEIEEDDNTEDNEDFNISDNDDDYGNNDDNDDNDDCDIGTTNNSFEIDMDSDDIIPLNSNCKTKDKDKTKDNTKHKISFNELLNLDESKSESKPIKKTINIKKRTDNTDIKALPSEPVLKLTKAESKFEINEETIDYFTKYLEPLKVFMLETEISTLADLVCNSPKLVIVLAEKLLILVIEVFTLALVLSKLFNLPPAEPVNAFKAVVDVFEEV